MLMPLFEEMAYIQRSYDYGYAHLFVKCQGIHLTKQKEDQDIMPVSQMMLLKENKVSVNPWADIFHYIF